MGRPAHDYPGDCGSLAGQARRQPQGDQNPAYECISVHINAGEGQPAGAPRESLHDPAR
jgi:hypothetical protein